MAFRFLSKQRVVVRLLFEIFLEAAAGFAIWIFGSRRAKKGDILRRMEFFHMSTFLDCAFLSLSLTAGDGSEKKALVAAEGETYAEAPSFLAI
jgi:hypothetical protein